MAIRNPIEWTAGAIGLVNGPARPRTVSLSPATAPLKPLAVRRINLSDIRNALAKGWDDFGATRGDVVFLCIFYPVLGLLFARLASGSGLLPLVVPLASGFALLGPLAGVGLYELSRRREQGLPTSLATPFQVARSSSFPSIVTLGALLFLLYALWLLTAWGLYAATLGPEPPASVSSFLRDVFTTGPGWTMMVAGIALGFVYACIALTLTVVSFPLMLDRNADVRTAVATSLTVVRTNLVPTAAWGLVIATGLVLGSIPLFLGLIVVLPVLSHATWHLYRRAVSA